jgi:hypothetical protein
MPSSGATHGAPPHVVAVFEVDLLAASTAVRVEVSRPGRGAVVVAGTPNEKTGLVETSPGTYEGALTGVQVAYTLSVDTSEGGLDGITLAAPAPQRAALDPSGELQWTPCNEENVDDVRVTLMSGESNYDVHTSDRGALTLPSDSLKGDDAWVRLERSSSARLAGNGIGFVHMIASVRDK